MHVENCRVGVEMDDTKFLRPTSVQTSATTWTYLDVDMSQVDDKILCSQCDFSYPKKYHVMKHIRATHTSNGDNLIVSLYCERDKSIEI